MNISTLLVTPETAADWLATNDSNRTVRIGTVAAFARDMRAGKWALNAETIKFDWFGKLRDGQHRLIAVTLAKVPVEMAVATGLDPAVFNTVDAGNARTAADVLTMQGRPYSFVQAGAARVGLILEGVAPANGKITNSEVEEYLDKHPEIEDAAQRTDQVRKRLKGVRPSLVAYADFAMSSVNAEATASFWHAASSLEAAYDGDPAVAVARRFADFYVKRQRLTDLEALDILYRAWNKRRRGDVVRTVKLVQVKSVDDLPKLR